MYGREARLSSDLMYEPPPDSTDNETSLVYFVVRQQYIIRRAYAFVRGNLGETAERRKHTYDLRTRSRQFNTGRGSGTLNPVVDLVSVKNGNRFTKAIPHK